MAIELPAYKMEAAGKIAEPANGNTFLPAGEQWIDPATGDIYTTNGHGLFEGFNGQLVRERPGHPLVLRDEAAKCWNGLKALFAARGLDEEQLVKVMRYHGCKLEFVPPIYSEEIDQAVQADLATEFTAKQLFELQEDARKVWAQFSSDWVMDKLTAYNVTPVVDFILDWQHPPESKPVYTGVENFTRAHDLVVRLDVDHMAASSGMDKKPITPKAIGDYAKRKGDKEPTAQELLAGGQRYDEIVAEAAKEGISKERCAEVLRQLQLDPTLGPPVPLFTPKRVKALEKLLVEYEIPQARQDNIRRAKREEAVKLREDSSTPHEDAVETDCTDVFEPEIAEQAGSEVIDCSPSNDAPTESQEVSNHDPVPSNGDEQSGSGLGVSSDLPQSDLVVCKHCQLSDCVCVCIDDLVDAWHNDPQEMELADYIQLVFPDLDYAVWVAGKDVMDAAASRVPSFVVDGYCQVCEAKECLHIPPSDDDAEQVLRRPVFAIDSDDHLDWLVEKVNELNRRVDALKKEKAERSGHLDVMIKEVERDIKKLEWRFTTDVIDYVVPQLPTHKSGDQEGLVKKFTYKVKAGSVKIEPTGGAVCVDENKWKRWVKLLPDDECPLYGVVQEKVNKHPMEVARSMVEAGVEIPGWRQLPFNPLGTFSVSVSKPRKKGETTEENESESEEGAA